MFQTDPFSGSKVAFSSHRGKRPHFPKVCPFCPGSEHVTPPETFRLPILSNLSKKTDWQVRAFPNAFPIIVGHEGRHEVIVESPHHGTLWEDFSLQHLSLVFQAYQHRFRALSRPKNSKYVLLFKNFGVKSGASQAHEHAQVVSFPFVPDAVQNELNETAVLDAWAVKEKAIVENRFFKAMCPPVCKYPYEVWILAKNRKARFDDFSLEHGVALLSLMQTVIRKVKKVQGAPDYTVVFHAAPPGETLRFHVEIIPRKAVWGGFELGSGVLVNFKEPRLAMEELKKV